MACNHFSFDFSAANLTLGDSYKRVDVADLVGYDEIENPRSRTGIYWFNKNAMVLWVTLDKSGHDVEHNYRDAFDEGGLFWDSQKSNTPETDHCSCLINENKPVYLFARIKKTDQFLFLW